MDYSNATFHGDGLPQHVLETIHKLAHAGASPEVISSFLGLRPEMVRQVLANDPSQVAKLTRSIMEESRKYRSGLSNRLMTSTVMARDGNYYEQSVLEAYPSIASERVVLNPKKKAKLAEFCRESLNGLAVHLKQKEPPEDILEQTAECLAMLNVETEFQTFLRVLDAVEGKTLAKLIDKLRHKVGEQDLITLLHRSTYELPTLALCLTKLFMLESLSERAFEKAFRCFTELLSRTTLSAGAIDLAEQVSESLNSTQLSQMNQALKRATLYHLHEVTLPTFIYSYEWDSDKLWMTSLVTGEDSCHHVPSYTFKYGCCWSEVPGGSLLITGGETSDYSVVEEVVRIDTRREFAVAHCAPMLTPRCYHAAVFHSQHLYVLGSLDCSVLSECERYVCTDNRWEALPPLPRACQDTTAVVIARSLYALGGRDGQEMEGSDLDLVQKLSLEGLTWELMQFRLPHADHAIPCFKLRDTEVYLVVNKTLCSFRDLQVRPLKTLEERKRSKFGPSFYSRGTLYCSFFSGPARLLKIGSLSI